MLRPDPRPLIGEPLALDLLNTEWIVAGEPFDLLARDEGVEAWLRAVAIDAPAGPATAAALRESRAAIRGVLDRGGPASRSRLNRVLAQGRVAHELTESGPTHQVEVDDPVTLPGVLAAHQLLDLLSGPVDRIRRCEHPNCVLRFLDTSRNGSRRWCSMAVCGNRTKAQRHYRKVRAVPDPG